MHSPHSHGCTLFVLGLTVDMQGVNRLATMAITGPLGKEPLPWGCGSSSPHPAGTPPVVRHPMAPVGSAGPTAQPRKWPMPFRAGEYAK